MQVLRVAGKRLITLLKNTKMKIETQSKEETIHQKLINLEDRMKSLKEKAEEKIAIHKITMENHLVSN